MCVCFACCVHTDVIRTACDSACDDDEAREEGAAGEDGFEAVFVAALVLTLLPGRRVRLERGLADMLLPLLQRDDTLPDDSIREDRGLGRAAGGEG